MYYANTKLLYPISTTDPEYRIPETANLQGLAYDYSDHTVITYDQVEKKLMWISRDSSAIVASCTVDTPIDQVLGMSQFQDFIYFLTYEGNGHLCVFTGSLSQGKEDKVLHVTRHDVPYSDYNPAGTDIWDRTHAALPTYLRYHPDYCNIFNIGPTIYLLIGLSNNVTPGTVPADLGQYIVEYDLNGLFRNQVKVDFSAKNNRNMTINGPNGTAVAAAWHDGILSLLCREIAGNQPNVVHILTYKDFTVSVADTFWYIEGSLNSGSALLVAGRYAYILVGNRIMKSEVTMIKLHMDGGWPNTITLDLGTLSSGQVAFRKVTCMNIAPVTTYTDLYISTTDPNLLLSLEDRADANDYANTITYRGTLAPGETFDFWVCLTAPTIHNEKYTPYQYYNKITLAPRMRQDYA